METKQKPVTDIVRSTIADTEIKFANVENSKMDFKKEGAFALQILKGNEFLYKTAKNNLASLADAVLNVALTGLTLNPVLKLAYLLPRDGKVCLVPSWMGLCKILTDAGSAKKIYAYVRYENDEFEMTLGTNPDIIHKPALSDRGEPVGVYAIAVLADDSKQFEYMDKKEVDKIMSKSEAVKAKKYSSWTDWWDEMARAKVIRRLYKYLSKTETNEALTKVIELTNDIDFEAEKQKFEQEKREMVAKRHDAIFKADEKPKEKVAIKEVEKSPEVARSANKGFKVEEATKEEIILEARDDEKVEPEKQTKHSAPLSEIVRNAIYKCKTEKELDGCFKFYVTLHTNQNFVNLVKDKKEFIKEKAEKNEN